MHFVMTLQKNIHGDYTYGYEPSVSELLAEPIVRQLMQRDGVEAHAMQRQFEQLARALAAADMLPGCSY